MNLNQIQVILYEPSHPGNIGAAARAIKNMGITRLTLIQPKEFPSEVANARASGAQDILDNARICDSLADAVADCHYVIGTTARIRNSDWPTTDVRGAVAGLNHRADQQIAIVFGTERTGLSNQEIDLCHQLIHIPVNEDFSSINLATAVMIVSYELNLAFGQGDESSDAQNDKAKSSPTSHDSKLAATGDEVEGFYGHFEKMLDDLDFYKGTHSEKLMRKLRHLYQRVELTKEEINIHRGIFNEVIQKLNKDKTE